MTCRPGGDRDHKGTPVIVGEIVTGWQSDRVALIAAIMEPDLRRRSASVLRVSTGDMN